MNNNELKQIVSNFSRTLSPDLPFGRVRPGFHDAKSRIERARTLKLDEAQSWPAPTRVAVRKLLKTLSSDLDRGSESPFLEISPTGSTSSVLSRRIVGGILLYYSQLQRSSS